MSQLIDSFSIDEVFNGPPASANGGYVCGRVTDYIDGPASVRLHAPPPLNKTLQLWREGDDFKLLDGEQLLVSARAADSLLLEVPKAPSLEDARKAGLGAIKLDEHIFPTCFVCGPARTAGDGLCVHVGPCHSEAPGMHAGDWVVDAAFCDDDGLIAPRFLWAALDCPSAYVNEIAPGNMFLLGSLSAEILSRPVRGEQCTVIAWPLAHDGRKHFAATAIFGADGSLHAVSSAIWIELKAQ